MTRQNKRDVLSVGDLSRAEVDEVFSLGREIRDELREARAGFTRARPHLNGASLAMIFEKPSLRTRCSFELGMFQLGGHSINLGSDTIGRLGTRESIADTARNLSRWVDLIMARVFTHDHVVELAAEASVPVINGLSDLEHPCQALADFFTILEYRGALQGFRLAWVGDGNNVCHSLMLLSAMMDTEMVMAIPPGYEPKPEVWKQALAINPTARLKLTHNPAEAVASADAIYTDVWASMGQEAEAKARIKAFADYQVNSALLEQAPDHAIVMHDMPAHRGEEITDEVLDSPRCLALDQAESRLHLQKALLVWLFRHHRGA